MRGPTATSDFYKLPTVLLAAADFDLAYQRWPTSPEDTETFDLSAYGEWLACEAWSVIEARDRTIADLEAKIKDLEADVLERTQEAARLADRIGQLEDR